MTISFSAPAMLTMGPSHPEIAGTLGEQLLRFLSLNREQRRNAAITIAAGVALPNWPGRRTFLDAGYS
jgi:hypothetical protein